MTRDDFLQKFQHLQRISPEADYPLRVPGKPAAVLMPVVEREEGLTLLFTRRAGHLKHHAGQVSFPGGKQEPSDPTLVETALRETEEEIGLSRDHIQIIGQLPQYRTVSKFVVSPYIAMVTPPFSLEIDRNEVDTVFEVPLTYALDQKNHLIHWVERKQRRHPIYFIPWQDIHIWGATAAFVRNLSNHFSQTHLTTI